MPRTSSRPVATPKADRPKEAADRIEIENVNVPGRRVRVDAAKYGAMREALLAALPARAPGLTQTEIREAVRTRLPQAIFPGGRTSSWWAKTVQLDLEAKALVVREAVKPLRWHRAAAAARKPRTARP